MSDSNLAVSSNASDILSLAEEFGIDLGGDMSTFLSNAGSSKYTNYVKPSQVRTVFDAHKLDGIIKWTEPDFDGDPSNRSAEILYLPDENGGEPREISGITELRGTIVNYQQRDELRYFDGEKTQTLCSAIGYRKEGKVVRDLPDVPYSMKYTFEKDRVTGKWSVNTTKPNKSVEQLGVVGYRGEKVTSCADCIRCGLSTEVISGIGENGADKKISCEPRGKLFMAVFSVSHVKKVKSSESNVKGKAKFDDQIVTYDVKNLVDFAGEPIGDFILVEVPMSKSSIQGRYVKNEQGKKDEEKSVDGYETFARNLSYTYGKSSNGKTNPMTNPKVHMVRLTFRKHPSAPTFQANFESLGVAGVEQFKAGMLFWQESVKPREYEELEVQKLNNGIEADGTINAKVVSQVEEEPKVKPVTEVVEDDVDDEDLPF